MFYRLNEQYALRGWQKMTGTLVKRPYNRVRPLTPEQFRVLMLCDGRAELSEGALSASERETLDFLVGKGVAVPSERPAPIQPWQEYRYFDNRYVESVFWSVTGRCNFKCRHCYMDAPDSALGELSHEEAMAVIEEMDRCGVLKVDLTGGEPFVRRDFWELVEAMVERGMTIGQVYTNGWLVNEQLLGEFEKRGLKPELMFSHDGIGWHDWMRGVPGAEKAVLRAMELCVARGFPVGVEMCIHKGNAHTLRETVKLMGGMGVPSLKCSAVSNTPLWRANSEGNAYSYREYVEDMIAYIPQYYEDGCPMPRVTLGGIATLYTGGHFKVHAERYSGEEDASKCHLCGAVRWSCYITPDGRLLPCMPMTACKEQELFPKIADIGLQKGLSDSFYMNFVDSRVGDLLKANEKCAACPHALKCGGGCRAAALEQTGDLMGAEEGICMLWNEGYVERIRRTAEEAVARSCPEKEQNEPQG